MKQEYFADARLLVSRAQGQVNDLETEIKRFFADEPWTTIVEPNVERTEYVHKFRFTKLFDPGLKAIASEAANNLRHALDHVVAECTRLNGAQQIKGAYFPFGSTAAKLDEILTKKKLSRVPPEVLAYFRVLNPYKGGNDRLYALSQISGRNKHWSLTPVFTQTHGVKVIHPDGRQRMVKTSSWAASPEDYLELFTSAQPDENYHVSLLITVRFDDIDALDKAHPVAALRDLAGVVNDIINDCEAICQRLGLL